MDTAMSDAGRAAAREIADWYVALYESKGHPRPLQHHESSVYAILANHRDENCQRMFGFTPEAMPTDTERLDKLEALLVVHAGTATRYRIDHKGNRSIQIAGKSWPGEGYHDNLRDAIDAVAESK